MIANARVSGTESALRMKAPKAHSVAKKVAMRRCVVLVLLFSSWMAGQRINAQTVPDVNVDSGSSTNSATPAPFDPAGSDDSLNWPFPVHQINRRLPSWLRIGGEFRGRLEGQTGIGYTSTNDFYLLDRLRLRLGIKPKEWLLFYGETQDARIFFNHHIPNANPYQDKWTLWQAYPQLGSSETGWIDALAGREVLRFGDERVIGPSEWLNVGRTFNVARVDLHHPGFLVSVFASSVVPGENTDVHNALPGNNMYGLYGSFQKIVPKADFEPYVLWRVAPKSPELPETLNRGHLNEVTIGLHWKGNLPAAFDYDTEFDGQTGSLGSSSIAAWAGYGSVGKTFRKVATTPRVFLEGNYASGTKNPNGHTWNTFDQIYPSNHDKYGFDDLVGRRNLEQFRTGVEEDPTKKWRFIQQFEGYWLATSNDNYYASSGAIAVAAHPGASRHIGNEFDAVAEYEVNKGLSFGFGYGRLFAGHFLKQTTPGHDYSYPYAYFEYNFSKSGFHFPITPNKPN
jgi:hypothetical protein